MELKARLKKPYTETQRIDFIIEWNHKHGYTIRETGQALEAWGKTPEEEAEEEKRRILELYMTRSDFFDGMIKAFGLDSAELRVIIDTLLHNINITDIEIKIAMNNYDNALNFYRKHTIFTLLSGIEIPIAEGFSIVITSEQWDKFFDETNKRNPDAYKELLPVDNTPLLSVNNTSTEEPEVEETTTETEPEEE